MTEMNLAERFFSVPVEKKKKSPNRMNRMGGGNIRSFESAGEGRAGITESVSQACFISSSKKEKKNTLGAEEKEIKD